MNKSCFGAVQRKYKQKEVLRHKNKCVGIRGGNPTSLCDQPLLGWKILCVQNRMYEYILKQLPNEKVYLCHNGVDTDTFKPVDRSADRFIVGWAGNPNSTAKRVWMLDKLGYNVQRQQNWNYDFFRPDRSRQEMIDFYSSIDAYVCTSNTEGMPQPVLEAGATKLPIVSTSVGGVPEFVDEKWLVPIEPESESIEQIKKKLNELEHNSDLRFKVGNFNYQKVITAWDWRFIIKEYDAAFEG
jgi:glycosyltransferase involved in cell wall biosynthesis